MENTLDVNGLVLPTLLTELLNGGRWRHPGDDVLRDLMPWFESPLDFLTSSEQIRGESRSLTLFADDPPSSHLFREARGSISTAGVELPWLDAEQAVLIAVNRIPGDDVAMALDYRTDPADPRVVASDFWTDPKQCSWRTVTPTFSQLVEILRLV
ncbi:hypothetical protein O7600_20055 [Micromonospora sp. WMMA1998]|uniref:hypothetical protein n=1 Tax=unclassified Micromonospora TaxID=2617518 RepID=UPI000C058AC3|nr:MULTISPECIES: hypothetical protein [unclassified Micromonospora]ATO15550.1 hypothetical protein CO540_18300 [Micromonospora sp. WMMA2032]WBC13426.1 hypothetical protein O7600_20055 [Micromonospora sp. WMMA1998]